MLMDYYIIYNLEEIIIYTLVYKALLGVKRKIFNKQSLILLFISSALELLACYYQWEILYELIIPLMAGMINCLLISDEKVTNILLFMPFDFIVSTTMNITMTLMIAKVIGVSQTVVLNSISYGVLSEAGTVICVSVLYFAIADKMESPFFKTRAQYAIALIGGFSLLITVSFSQYVMEVGFVLTQGKSEILEILSLLGTFIFFALFIIHQMTEAKNFKYRLYNERYNDYLINQENYYRKLILADEQRRKLRHDLRSHLLVLDSLAKDNKFNDLRNYLKRMENFIPIENTHQYIYISSVDSIIDDFRKKADNASIDWQFTFSEHDRIEIEIFELCILFSNLLSNAIEAASKASKDKKIEITVKTLQGRFLLKIRNSCNVNKKISKRPQTTKADHTEHGYGLKNVEDIVKKHNGDIQYSCDNGIFQTIIIL